MVHVDPQRVASFAGFMRTSGDLQPFHFSGRGPGEPLPPAGTPGALDAFFFVTAHQFGFWYERAGRYDRPMIARIEGRNLKGSDYLFRCVTRALESRADFFAPAHLLALSDEDWNRVFADDAGVNPLPMWRDNLDLIHGYARWFREQGTTPAGVVERANAQPRPLAAFLAEAGRIPGYAEDPLRKKLQLLAVILENRPEHFLRVTDPESYEPIIDYHLQRSALRTGLVVVDDAALKARLEARAVVSAAEEDAVRRATFEAIRRLVEQSGKSVAAVDWFFFTNRRRCPEMTEPECAVCPVQSICRRETKLFQPVFRTTAY
jgi:hypothetical protein